MAGLTAGASERRVPGTGQADGVRPSVTRRGLARGPAPPRERRGPGLPAAVLGAVLCLAAALTAGCGSGLRSDLPRTVDGDGRAGGTAVWGIPPGAYPAQRLYRMEAETARDRATFRAVLRIERPDRYRLTLSDRLGRTLFTLDAGPDSGWLLDHRARRACPLAEVRALGDVPLGPLPPEALPAVLLGRVPAAPAGPVAVEAAGRLSYRDVRGWRWSVRFEEVRAPAGDGTGGRRVLGWTVRRRGRSILWWRRDGAEGLLSDRERGLQLRWHEVAREPLAETLPAPEVPSRFERGVCGERSPGLVESDREGPSRSGTDGGSATGPPAPRRFDSLRPPL